MLRSHISYAEPVLHWILLVASVVVLDQFAIFVPVWEGPARLIMCMHTLASENPTVSQMRVGKESSFGNCEKIQSTITAWAGDAQL